MSKNFRKPRKDTKQLSRTTARNKMTQDELFAILNATPKAHSIMRGPFPFNEIVNYRFLYTDIVQGAAAFFVREFRMNSVYQPIVGGATGVLSGYAASAARYALYRVEANKVQCRVQNNENFAVHIAFIVSDTQPSTVVTTYQTALTVATGTGCLWHAILGYNTGQGRATSSVFKVNPGSVVGNPLAYMADFNFASAFGANPNQIVWGGLIIISDASTQNLTNGVFPEIDFSYRTRNYSPRPEV